MKGIVKSWNETKGFGFIGRQDGDDVFVHKTGLTNGITSLNVGDEVQFDLEDSPTDENPNRKRAVKVRRIKASGQNSQASTTGSKGGDSFAGMTSLLAALTKVVRDLRADSTAESKAAMGLAEDALDTVEAALTVERDVAEAERNERRKTELKVFADQVDDLRKQVDDLKIKRDAAETKLEQAETERDAAETALLIGRATQAVAVREAVVDVRERVDASKGDAEVIRAYGLADNLSDLIAADVEMLRLRLEARDRMDRRAKRPAPADTRTARERIADRLSEKFNFPSGRGLLLAALAVVALMMACDAGGWSDTIREDYQSRQLREYNERMLEKRQEHERLLKCTTCGVTHTTSTVGATTAHTVATPSVATLQVTRILLSDKYKTDISPRTGQKAHKPVRPQTCNARFTNATEVAVEYKVVFSLGALPAVKAVLYNDEGDLIEEQPDALERIGSNRNNLKGFVFKAVPLGQYRVELLDEAGNLIEGSECLFTNDGEAAG